MRKSDKVWLFCAFTLPCFLFLSLWQFSRFERIENEILILNGQQNSWYEANRRLISKIAVYSSPERIGEIAEGQLILTKDEERDVIRIVVRD